MADLDLEDLAEDSGPQRPVRAPAVKVRGRARETHAGAAAALSEAAASGVPGTQRVWVKTYGCSHNTSDGEYMAGLLHEYGYELADGPEGAHVWLINSCTVKGPSQEHLLTDVRRARAASVPVIVAGCVSQAHPELEPLAGLSMIGVEQIDRVVEVVGLALQGHAVRLLARRTGAAASAAGGGDGDAPTVGPTGLPSLELPKVRRNALVEVVPCNVGCLGSCTYCKTVHARGRLTSYPLGALLARTRAAVAAGCREVWLTSEDTGAYGRDLGLDMPTMVRALAEQALPPGGEVMLRVGMANPPYMLEHLDEIVRVLNHPAVYAFLHVPVQSGSDRTLRAMNREYTAAEFRHVADALLAAVPELTLATDVICGFPAETDADHAETMALLAEYRFAVLNISQFYPRPGTPAAKLAGRVPTQLVKARTREVSALFGSYETHAHLCGRTFACLVIEVSSDGRYVVGHSRGYVQVLLQPDWPALPAGAPAVCAPAASPLLGARVEVRVDSCGKFWVKAQVLRVLSERPSAQGAGAVVVGKRAALAAVDAAPAEALVAAPDAAGCAAGGGCGGGDAAACCQQPSVPAGRPPAAAGAARRTVLALVLITGVMLLGARGGIRRF